MDVQVRTTRVECAPASLQDVGPVLSTGHAALLTWHPQKEGEAPAVVRNLVPLPREASGTMGVVCSLQTQALRQGQAGAQRTKALEWARDRCHEAVRVALHGAGRLPMEVARRRDAMEVTFVVRTEAVPAILATSGQVLGWPFGCMW